MGDCLAGLIDRLRRGLAVRCALVAVVAVEDARRRWRTFAWERSLVHAPGSFADWVNARLRSLFSFLILFADMVDERSEREEKRQRPVDCFILAT